MKKRLSQKNSTPAGLRSPEWLWFKLQSGLTPLFGRTMSLCFARNEAKKQLHATSIRSVWNLLLLP